MARVGPFRLATAVIQDDSAGKKGGLLCESAFLFYGARTADVILCGRSIGQNGSYQPFGCFFWQAGTQTCMQWFVFMLPLPRRFCMHYSLQDPAAEAGAEIAIKPSATTIDKYFIIVVPPKVGAVDRKPLPQAGPSFEMRRRLPTWAVAPRKLHSQAWVTSPPSASAASVALRH